MWKNALEDGWKITREMDLEGKAASCALVRRRRHGTNLMMCLCRILSRAKLDDGLRMFDGRVGCFEHLSLMSKVFEQTLQVEEGHKVRPERLALDANHTSVVEPSH